MLTKGIYSTYENWDNTNNYYRLTCYPKSLTQRERELSVRHKLYSNLFSLTSTLLILAIYEYKNMNFCK